uniref:Uncharacterized protein n=1 Tax=Podoviridae sp. ct8Lf7 TaxID=2827723 RepID=A0A8S5S1M4_9CAUD|nr:MAG TPA: hypothetical protein [Podoviridae sp. ct8Lf7]
MCQLKNGISSLRSKLLNMEHLLLLELVTFILVKMD